MTSDLTYILALIALSLSLRNALELKKIKSDLKLEIIELREKLLNIQTKGNRKK